LGFPNHDEITSKDAFSDIFPGFPQWQIHKNPATRKKNPHLISNDTFNAWQHRANMNPSNLDFAESLGEETGRSFLLMATRNLVNSPVDVGS